MAVNWRALFDAETLAAGETLYTQGKAKRPSEEEDGFYATVRDARNHKIYVEDYGDGIEDLNCDCDTALSGRRCAHEAAALLLLEDVFDYYEFDVNEDYAEACGIAEEVLTPEEFARRTGVYPEEHARPKLSALANAHKDAIFNIEELFQEDQRQRDADVSDERTVEEYRYFRTEHFRDGLVLSSKTLREAEKLFATGEATGTEFRTGHMRSPHIRLELGENALTEPELRLHVTQHSRRGSWQVDQIYGWNELEYSHCSDWQCQFRTRRQKNGALDHVLCVHEAAALLATEAYLRENNIGDSSSSAALQFLEDFSPQTTAVVSSDAGEILSLCPQVRIDARNHWLVQFQVGSKRLYKIKNLQEFLRGLNTHEKQQYGKSTVLQLGREYLDEEGAGWLRFIEQALESVRVFSGSSREDEDIYYYGGRDGWQKLTDRIPLFGDILDRFYDQMGDTSVECERTSWALGQREEKEKYNLRSEDGKLRPSLVLSPWFRGEPQRFEGVLLTGQLPEFIRGSSHTYVLRGHTLQRLGEENAKQLAPLFHAAVESGVLFLKIGRGSLADFYRKALPALREAAEITETDPGIADRYLPDEPSFICYLDVDDDCVLCRPMVSYGRRQHSTFDVYIWRAHSGMPQHYRDMSAEERLMDLLETYMPERDDLMGLFVSARGELPLYQFLEHGITELLEISEVRATDRFRRLRVRRSVPFTAGVSLASGIMDLTLTSEELTPDELMTVFRGYQKKLSFVRLRNGNFLRLDENEEIRRLIEIMETLHISPKDFAKGKMHIPAFRAIYLDAMLEQMEDVYAERDSRFKKLIKEFKTVSDADYEVPENLRGVMRKYQTTGYRWLRTLDDYHFGGILADDMGLGKTLQAIAVMLADHNEIDVTDGERSGDASSTSLVVCPASLVYNWQEELRRFAPSLHTLLVVGTADERREKIARAADYDVLVTSYDLLKRDIAEYEGISFRYEIIDEAQYIKNHETAAAKSVKLIAAQTKYALTGTPIENRLSELWSIFDYLMPGFLYEYGTFRKEFELPIAKGADENIMDRLRRMVAPFILRRTKKEVLKDLPEKLEEIRYAGFESGGEQQRLYNAQVVRMREDLAAQTDEDFRRGRIEILAELMRIRQICCDPSLCFEGYSGESAKREACMDLIRSVAEGEHKALIFSQFTSMLELLRADLDREGIPYYVITGATKKEDRVRLAKAFNADATPVFLISLKAGGTGLNLTGADVVIHYDPWWNVAVQNQATDRAHRIGQDKVVTVYRLILRDTIEERIVELQEKKRALAEDILSAEAVGSAAISREELLELLG